MRVALIGPVAPFRGGISHSNTVLCTYLAKHHNLFAVSFSRMFPEFLYPGKSQKDSSASPSFPVRYTLDSLNPASWVQVAQDLVRKKVDVVLFQWWSPFFTPCYTTIAFLVRTFGKAKVGVICQNVALHEGGLQQLLGRHLTKAFFSQADHFITYSSSDRLDLKKLLPSAKVDFVIEGAYDNLGSALPREKAKQLLGMRGDNLLFFGFVRPYKGLHFLLRALPAVLKKHPLTLHIVGEFWEPKASFLEEIRSLGIEKHVKIVDRYVSNEEAVRYFSAVDAVVLPYTSSTESGIIQLAYGLNTPIITTNVGGNKDLVRHDVTGLLARPASPESLAQQILWFYQKKRFSLFKKNMQKTRSLLAWTPEKEKVLFG